MKKFIEIGFGNRWFIRTEFEHSDGTESEIKGVAKPFILKSIYLRVWLGRRVLIIDTKDGIKLNRKDKKKFKFLIGFRGV